jgi:cardiolipin synthase
MVRFPYFTSRINYRNHRKIVVVDGVVGFVGGINIADRYRYGLPEGGSWRDTHLRIEGNAVTSLQSVFILDWFFVSRQRIRDKRYFPDNSHIQGSYSIQIASSGPDSDFKTIEQAFFRTIASARRYVYIQSPYFLPTEPVLMAIRTAALSGTDVRIMLPGISDAIITSASTNSYIKEMLLSGVKVYFYAKGFLHAKTLVSDDVVSTVGTTNMDFRSFDYNFEVNAFVYNREFAQIMKHTFEKDMHDCHEIKLSEWNRRPVKQKITESVARLFSPLL